MHLHLQAQATRRRALAPFPTPQHAQLFLPSLPHIDNGALYLHCLCTDQSSCKEEAFIKGFTPESFSRQEKARQALSLGRLGQRCLFRLLHIITLAKRPAPTALIPNALHPPLSSYSTIGTSPHPQPQTSLNLIPEPCRSIQACVLFEVPSRSALNLTALLCA
eukprot:1161928-Pelagomonas_calceolata.AAC.1